MKKRKPINFTAAAVQDEATLNLTRAAEHDTERESSSNTCFVHEDEPYCKMETEQFFERYLTVENTAVVVTSSTFLHGSDYKCQRLPLGLILNALFRYDNWLYVRTAHGQEGYIAGCTCLPLGAPSFSAAHTTIESDAEFEPLESLYKWNFDHTINYNERNVDLLYLQANGIRRRERNHSACESEDKSIKLVVKNDFTGSVENTISVRKGDIVFLQHSRVVGWFWVKNEVGREGFIPIAVAGYMHYK